jgi:SAM-dependent methyltransferase
MAQRSGGLYHALEVGRVYDLLQRLMGGAAARARVVREFVRPPPGAQILDIGCGPGTLLDALPPDVRYVGFDLNPAYVELARARFGDRAQFHCAAVGERWDFEVGSFDLVIACAVLHHLDDAEATALVATAVQALRPAGALVTLDPTRHRCQHPVARWLVALDRGRCVRSPEGYRQLLEPSLDVTESWLVTDLAPLPYSHWVMRARPIPENRAQHAAN